MPTTMAAKRMLCKWGPGLYRRPRGELQRTCFVHLLWWGLGAPALIGYPSPLPCACKSPLSCACDCTSKVKGWWWA